MMRTVRERSAEGGKCKEVAWWLKEARRDPNVSYDATIAMVGS